MDTEISSLNDPPRLLPGSQLLHDLIQWDEHEDSCAIDFTSHDKREKYRYQDIQACVAYLVTRIQSKLRGQQESQQQHIVPILLPQSPGLYISQLAILQSGGAFCPINLDAPKDRIRFVVGDISATIIITTSEFREFVSWENGPTIIIVDEFPAIPTKLEESSGSREPTSNDLAYVMYTSGSSGTPKGVAVSHLAASQSLLAHESLIPKFERFLQFAAPSFDVSVFEIFFPLTRGQTLVGCDRSQLLNNLPGMINQLEIDAAELTPTVVGALLQKRAYVPKLRLLMTIGEMLTRPIVEEFGGSDTKESLLYGMYGPTEAAIHCAIHPKMEANAKSGNIGVPFETVSAFIAEAVSGSENEQDLQFLPQGELGELILGGPQLANGYLNREEQNRAAFVTIGNKSYYRTGDKGRILEDGSIEIHGRMSGGQIKLRGQRVELGEIEDAVYKHPGIKTVVAVVLSGVLVVFALTDEDRLHPDQVLSTCSLWLPSFMVPSEVVLLLEFPYLPSGKVDKRKLEADYQQHREGENELTNLTKTEIVVKEVLRETLGSFPSNIRLAAAGLDSLVSIKVSRELRSRGFNVTTLEVLRAEYLRSLVKLCENCPEDSSSARITGTVTSSESHTLLNGDAKDIEVSYPCTPLQNAMLAETAIEWKAYQNRVELDFPGLSNIHYLRTKLHDLADRNSVLRTGFAESSDNSGYMQFVWKTFPDSHIETVEAFTPDFQVSKYVSLHHPIYFEILSSESYLKLLIHIHHALYDAWSLDLLLDDLNCLLQDETPISRPPFADVVRGYIDGRLSSNSQVATDYWKDHLAHLELKHIPNFHTGKAGSTGLATAHRSTQLSTFNIELAAKRMASSPQAVLQAAYALILASYLGSADVCFGTVFSGRTLPIAGIEDIIGPCLATLPLRVDTSIATSLQDLVEEFNNTNRKHLEYSTLPLRDIKSVNGLEPRQQLFDTLLIWQQTLHSYDHSRRNVSLANQVDQLEFNLTLEITPTSDTIHFKANYQQSVFPESQIDILLRQLEETTRIIIEHAEKSPQNIFNESDPAILSVENPTPDVDLGCETLISPVERMARENPDSPAIAFASRIDGEDSEVQYMSYGALNTRANRLGHYLSHHGVLPNDVICICVEKCHDFYASILATTKLGAGYLPVTPDIPHDRLQHILSEANVKVLIGQSLSRPLLERFTEQTIVYIDEIDVSRQSADNLISVFKPENISYCVFTSGSTGTPKGVLVTQGNLLSNLDVLVDIYPVTMHSKLLQSCSQAFDVSVFEIFFTWRIGGCLCSAVKDDLFRDIELAIRVLGATHLSLTPTVAALIDPQNVPEVKFLVTAGEAVTQKVFNAWANHGLYQGYGPSETTNICTVKPQVTLDDRIDNIGRPFKNTSAFVLARNTEFCLVPRGGEGEFCFGGSQVFRGYMDRAQEEGKIINHPKYGRLYKSGDFGRLMPDGSLVFTGRKDDQVKIRGQRVELGEINNILISLPEVKDCVTMVINGIGNSQRLVCFFTPEQNAFEGPLALPADPVMIADIYQALESKLPNYMVPSNLVPISNLPSTSQGKIDKRRMISLYESLELNYLDSTTRASKTSIDHQWSGLELDIRSMLSEISKTSVQDIGPDTSFFSLGIDSILAIAFSRKLRQAIAKQVNISDILRYTSVFRLAQHLSKSQEIEEGGAPVVDTTFDFDEEFVKTIMVQYKKKGRVAKHVRPCTPLQEAMLSAAESSSDASYKNHVILDILGDLERLRNCWKAMAKRHEILRTCFFSTDMQKFPYVQVVLEDFDLEFGSLDSGSLQDAIIEMETHPADNENTPPYRLDVLRSGGEQRLLVSMHHALYDGVALAVLYDEIEKSYHELPLPTPVSFTPFLQQISSMDVASSDKFWESTLQGYQPLRLENVSNKHSDIQKHSTRVQQLVAKIPLSEIENSIKKHITTPLAVFHTIWASTLSDLFKTTDICFGNVVSGRTASVDGVERLVAPCFNTIPTRLKDLHKSTYLEAFRTSQNANANSLPFQFTPLRRLQSRFSPDGTRLFDTLFILQQPSKELDSSIWTIVEDNGAMDFPLICEIVPKPSNDTLEIGFHSSPSIISEKDAYNLIQKFENKLQNALENPRRQITSSSSRAQIITMSEERENKKQEIPIVGLQSKVMSQLESEIRGIVAEFSDVSLEKIGRDTSIFKLGLDSISTVQVASRLRARGHNLLASDILQHPTIAQIASHLERSGAFKSEDSQYDFAAFDQKYRDKICSRNAFPDDNVEAIRPCTAVQQGMLAQSLHSEGHEYINSISLEVLPEHPLTMVKDAWTEVCQAHEMLRTSFAQTGDPNHPFVMITFRNNSFVLPWFESREQALSKDSDSLRNPWSMTLDQKENKTLLIFTAHHALYDAQSMQIIFSDFTKLYHSQAVVNRPNINILLSSVLQASKGDQDEKKAFWEQPENRIVVNKFPDLTPLRVASLSNAVREVKSLASLRELEDRCRGLGVTMQAAGQATWARLLMAYTGENVTTFGMTLSGRSVCDDANMVAFPTIITLPVNCNVMGSNSELLSRTMSFNAQLHKHQFTPLTSIQRWAGYPEGKIFDTLFAYQKLPDDEDVPSPPWKIVNEEASVDYVVSLELQPSPSGEVTIRLSFREDTIPTEHAELMVKQFDALLLDTLKNPNNPCNVAPVAGIDLLSITPAQNPVLPDSVTLLHQYVERGAKIWPDKVALEFATSLRQDNYKSRKWTYQQLEEEANRVAQMLHTHGITPGEIIAICFDKCAEASFTIIGIMKAGCGYVALDPNAPADRLKFIVEDSAAKLIITAGSPAQSLRSFVDGMLIDLTDPAILREFACEAPQLSREIMPQDISYCLYTSGTTGTPKGCLLTHENAIQAMLAFQKLFAGHWTTDSKWLQFASFHFDVSVLEQFWSWSVGICVASAPRDLIFEDIPGAIHQLGITHIDLTPSLARLLHPDDVPSLCKGVFITGGEQLKQEILDVWGEHACIYNGYGPTEATIGVTMYPRVPKNGKPSNIGPQFENVGSYVLKPGTELPVLRGGIGELCVSGKLVGKGYLNRPALTTERFPTLGNFGERVYRTGDLVRILHDGTFLFLGRADDQVKLRGQRLELGEINEVIKKSRHDLEEVVTLVLKHKTQVKEQLVTFFVISGKAESESSEVVPFIRDACKSRLPGYMVPTHFIPIKALPLNANNKADSKQLAETFNEMSVEDLQNLSLSEQSHTEWTETEKEVVQDIIEAFPVDVPDLTRGSNIFQLGLDSISVTAFSESLRVCGYNNATNSAVRSNPTIGELVKALLVVQPDNGKEKPHLIVAKQNIAGFSQQHAVAICKELGVRTEDVECIAPCTPVQQGMIYKFLESDRRVYYNKIRHGLKPNTYTKPLLWAWDNVVGHLQILRTKFVMTDDGFAQVVLKSMLPTRRGASKVFRKHIDILKNPWSLETQDSDIQDTLTLNIFHGLYDGHSMGIMLNHLSDEYHRVSLSPSVVQYIPYGPPFHSSLAYGPLAIIPGAKSFWKSHLETWSHFSFSTEDKDDGVCVTSLCLDVQDFEDTRKTLSVLPQAIVQAAWIAALQSVVSRNLTTIGIVTSGRTMDFEGVERVAGPLFNTIPFHLPINPGTQMSSVIKRCHLINGKMQDFQHTPLRDIKRWIPAGANEALFETLFVFQRPDVHEERCSNCLGSNLENTDENAADYPLALEATLSHDNTQLSLKIVAKRSVLIKVQALAVLKEMGETIETILAGRKKKMMVTKKPKPLPKPIPMPMPMPKRGTKSELNLLLPNPRNEFTPAVSTKPPSGLPTMKQQAAVLTNLKEEEILLILSEISILAKVNNTNFKTLSLFELGLDSINLIQLSSRLHKKGIELTVSSMVQCKDVADVLEKATLLEAKTHHPPSAEKLNLIIGQLKNLPDLPQNIEQILPATPLQQSMLTAMVNSEFRDYFTIEFFNLNNGTDGQELMRAVDRVIENSPILRTTFLKVHDPRIPVTYAQIIHKESLKVSDRAPIIAEGHLSFDEFLNELTQRLRDGASIEKDLFDVFLAEVEDKKVMVMAISHALYDGASLQMIHDDIFRAYYHKSEISRPCYLPFMAEIFNSTTNEAEDFWKTTLLNSPPSVFPKNELPPCKSKTYLYELRSKFSLEDVKTFCRLHNTTTQSLGLTCWALVLAGLMGQFDVVFGAVLACRDTAEAGQVNFPLFNTVAVRSRIHGTVNQMLRNMQENINTVRQFQHFPLHKAQSYALGSRDDATKDATMFDTLFINQGAKPKVEKDPLYSTIAGSSGVEFAICVEMELDDEADGILWTTACKSEARNSDQTMQIGKSLDKILEQILKREKDPVLTYSPDGISICKLPKFQARDTSPPTRRSSTIPTRGRWTPTELKLRESISALSGLLEKDIHKDSTIFQLGLDSLAILKLPNLLKTQHNIHLIASDIMKYLTIHDMANYLSERNEAQHGTIDADAILAGSIPSIINNAVRDQLQTNFGPIKYIMPATAGQRYMIRRWRNSQGSHFYSTFTLHLPYNCEKKIHIETAWSKLLQHSDILRTGFYESGTDSTIAQIVYKSSSNSLIDLTTSSKPQYYIESSKDLGHLRSPPIRLFLTSTMDNVYSSICDRRMAIQLVIHHALYDGISIELLTKALMTLIETPGTISTFENFDDKWKTFVATTIQAKNRQVVRDQWVRYLGAAIDHKTRSSSEPNVLIEPQTIDAANEVARQTEVFVPKLPAKRLKQLAKNAEVSIDNLLIVMASKLFRVRQRPSSHSRASTITPTPDSDSTQNGRDLIIGLYLANRFPFDEDLSSMPAPTLNLLPIKITEGNNDFTTLEVLAKNVQKDLRMISQGDMASVGLEEIYEWTGVRVFGWINIIRYMEERKKEESVDRTDDEKPRSLGPVMNKEGFARVVSPKRSNCIRDRSDCGAYAPSIDIELRYHPENQTLDIGIFGPESMISLAEAENWIELIKVQI